MGLQHALAMVGGLITPPLIIGLLAANDPTLSPSEVADRQNHLVSSGLIVTGAPCLQSFFQPVLGRACHPLRPLLTLATANNVVFEAHSKSP